MHGNTITSETGYKTRPFDRILSEVKTFFAGSPREGTHGARASGDDGTERGECTGGARISRTQTSRSLSYGLRSALNAEQSIDLAFLVADCSRRSAPLGRGRCRCCRALIGTKRLSAPLLGGTVSFFPIIWL